MNRKKPFLRPLFVTLLSGLMLLSCSTPSQTGNSSKSGEKESSTSNVANQDSKIRNAYELFLNAGGTLTYEEWLETVKGNPGKDGVGIASIAKTGSSGLTDTYTITYSDGSTFAFTVTNGAKGENGRNAYSCTILPSANGYVSVSVGSAFVGEDITFIAYPEQGFSLAHLYLNGVDVIGEMTDPVTYTTQMVENGFVFRGVFEIARRVSDEVFDREITKMGLLTNPDGFTMKYDVDVKGGSYHSTTAIKKSGRMIQYLTDSNEALLVGNGEGPNYETFTVYSRYQSWGEWNKWGLANESLEAELVWMQLIPGFTSFSQLEYTYDSSTGYYMTSADSLTMPDGQSKMTDFNIRLGFFDNRVNEFYCSYVPSGQTYTIEIKGSVYDYDGKTTIDEDYVANIIEEASRVEMAITLWVSEGEEDFTRDLLEDFEEDHPDYSFSFDISHLDPSNLLRGEDADIYCFYQDQVSRFVSEGYLSPLEGEARTKVEKENVDVSIEGATLGDKLYAYPLTADNGYFMYYDKSVISESHLNDLSSLVADCEKAGRYFAFEGSSAWYNSSFFLGAGCHSIWSSNAEGAFGECDDNYYSPEGIVALKGLSQLVSSRFYLNGSGSGYLYNSALMVSGTWDYQSALEYWGDNLGCAPLPSFTVDGESYHMGSFQGCKYLGVKPQKNAQKEKICHEIAAYLTSYEAQSLRVKDFNCGPTNLQAMASSDVQQSPALKALFDQMDYATIQGQFPGDWWGIAGRLASAVRQLGKNPEYEDLKSILYDYNEEINEIAPNKNPTPTFPQTQQGGEGGEGGQGGEDVPAPWPEYDSGFGLMIGNRGVLADPLEDYDFGGRLQYLIEEQDFYADETFTLYDFENKIGWVIDIDPYFFDAQGDPDLVSEYVVKENGVYRVVQDFTANVYLKFKTNDDQIYFGLA